MPSLEINGLSLFVSSLFISITVPSSKVTWFEFSINPTLVSPVASSREIDISPVFTLDSYCCVSSLNLDKKNTCPIALTVFTCDNFLPSKNLVLSWAVLRAPSRAIWCGSVKCDTLPVCHHSVSCTAETILFVILPSESIW